MVAGVRPTEALIWLVPPDFYSALRVVVSPDSAGAAVRTSSVPMTAAPGGPAGAVVAHLRGLRPNTRYVYQIQPTGATAARIWPVLGSGHFRTPPPDTVLTDFTFAVGSCALVLDPYPTGGYPIFGHIHQQRPDLMLWLGDNVYLGGDEWLHPPAAIHRYAHVRALPNLQSLLADATNVAIWDDHDFGPNNADSTLPTRAAMLGVFRAFWPHDLYEAAPGGATGHFRWGDAEFFLLDGRYWRTPKHGTAPRHRSQLGARQRAWLVAGLARSTATFKFVAVGGQVLSTNAHGETFANGFRRERRALLRALDSAQVKNVVFLTGDRHFGELSVRRPRRAPVQYDLTASPLTAGTAKVRANRRRVRGTAAHTHNFATIRMGGAAGARHLTLTSFDGAGRQLWQQQIAAARGK